MYNILVKRLTHTAKIPTQATEGSACFDLYVDEWEWESHGYTVHTGLSVAIPPGFVMLVFPRSGLSVKLGLSLCNGVGVIDSDYRGELLIKLNHAFPSVSPNEVLKALQYGNRVAQIMMVELPGVQFMEVDTLAPTARGTGGFGSTGV
jgi:dUTP pyrophosphatase